MSMPSIWTNPEATVDLQKCIAAGISANKTSAILSEKYQSVSRSACIGRAWREKMKFCSEREHRAPRRRNSCRRQRVMNALGTFDVPLSLVQADQDIPAEQRKQLLELTNATCRYPIGEAREGTLFFCGAPEADNLVGVVYCARHSRIATNR